MKIPRNWQTPVSSFVFPPLSKLSRCFSLISAMKLRLTNEKLRVRRRKANARERTRMHGLNAALDQLRRQVLFLKKVLIKNIRLQCIANRVYKNGKYLPTEIIQNRNAALGMQLHKHAFDFNN